MIFRLCGWNVTLRRQGCLCLARDMVSLERERFWQCRWCREPTRVGPSRDVYLRALQEKSWWHKFFHSE